jgi:hypothetical protein
MVANNTTGAEEAGGSWRLVRRYCLDMGGRRGRGLGLWAGYWAGRWGRPKMNMAPFLFVQKKI